MSVKFDNRYFEELGRSAGVERLVMDAAERVAATARATAPHDTGAYRDGIKVQKKYNRRVIGLVVGTDRKTMLIESKTGNLARALRTNVKGGRRA